jgi:hypothetical protein
LYSSKITDSTGEENDYCHKLRFMHIGNIQHLLGTAPTQVLIPLYFRHFRSSFIVETVGFLARLCIHCYRFIASSPNTVTEHR